MSGEGIKPGGATGESVLMWAEGAYRDAKAITKELSSHITLVEVRECGEAGGGEPDGRARDSVLMWTESAYWGLG